MRKTAIALMLLLACAFPLNVSASPKEDRMVFTIDGDHFAPQNLTIFVLKNGIQLRGEQRNNVVLPYFYTVQYNGSGTYEINVMDSAGGYGHAGANVTVQESQEGAETAAEDRGGTEIAVIAAIIGLAILAFISLRFIKGKSYNK